MKRKITITIDESLYKKLETEKKLRNRSTSNLIETVLIDYLNKEESQYPYSAKITHLKK